MLKSKRTSWLRPRQEQTCKTLHPKMLANTALLAAAWKGIRLHPLHSNLSGVARVVKAANGSMNYKPACDIKEGTCTFKR